jgi:hypothetical protein
MVGPVSKKESTIFSFKKGMMKIPKILLLMEFALRFIRSIFRASDGYLYA